MPQVRLYDGGGVQRSGTTGARLRTVDAGPSPLAVGLETAGRVLSETADKNDQIQEIYDRNDADKLALAHLDTLRTLRQTVKETRGADAQSVVAEQSKALQEQTSNLLASARSPRARAFLEHEVASRNADELDSWETHGYSEFVTDRKATLDAKVTSLGEEAADAPDDATAEGLISQAAAAAEERVRFDGHTDPAVIGVARAAATSKAYVQRAYGLNAADKPEEALAYLDAHKGQIATDDEMPLRIAIKRQLDDMAADSDAAAAMGYAGHSAPAALDQAPKPLVPGNIDIHNRPVAHNADGSISTVRSISIEVDGKEVLIPTVVGGKVVSDKEAIAHYRKTGENLGTFRNADEATAYAQSLHEQQAAEYLPPGETGFLPPIRVRTTTVKGGEYGAPRSYGGHVGRDYAGVPQGTPVYPMAAGTVKKVYRSEKGGNTVEIAMAGGWTMRVLHLQDGSTRHLAPGESVGVNDQIGAVGATGAAAHGAHAHVEVLKPNGQRVDPAAVIGSAGPASQKALPPPPDGRRIDVASAYRYIDEQVAAGNWTRARGERAKQQVNQHTSLNDQIRARGEDDARRVVDRQLADMTARGDKPTGWGKFDPSATAALDPETRLQYERMFAENRKPSAPDANGAAALTLTLMSINEPDRFKQQNLLVYRNQVTPGEFESLATTQAKMRQEKAGASPTANLRSAIDTTIRFYSPDIALDMSKATKPGTRERENYLKIFNLMQGQIDRITEGKRAPTDQEMKSAFDRATMQVVQTEVGLFGQHQVMRRAYEANPSAPTKVQVPLPVQTRIINAFRVANGRLPTERELMKEYIDHKGQRGFWQ
jgi:murein DD-endopeptidase MepM/ murein hydrolase activator NlpD